MHEIKNDMPFGENFVIGVITLNVIRKKFSLKSLMGHQINVSITDCALQSSLVLQ